MLYGEWCNGSTADSGSACLGSNPSSPAFHHPSQQGFATGFSVSFFLEEGAVAPQVVLWRKKPESPRAEELQARLVRLGEQYHHLEMACNACESCDMPFHTGPADHFGYAQAEKLALQ